MRANTRNYEMQFTKGLLSNLLGNAVKFTRDMPRPAIRIDSVELSDGPWLRIADNGRGFDMSLADKMFQPFQRLHDGSVEGIGIGLATVKRIVDRLGGSIVARSGEGEGATFLVRFQPPRT